MCGSTINMLTGQVAAQVVAARLARTFILLASLGMLLGLIGCDVPAQIVWSPDGSQAAYRSGNTAFLLNEQGIVLQPLGSSVGGFVWSADSKSLYFAANDEDSEAPTPLNLQWQGPDNSATTQPSGPTTQPATAAAPPSQPKSITVVSVLNNGNATPLFRLADVTLWHLQLSPDGQWLAAMTRATKDDGSSDEYRLFVYSIHGGSLYQLSQYCGMGACFTGPNKLAFIEANGIDEVGKLTGHIVEVKLDPEAPTLPRKPLLNVVMSATIWLEHCEGGLLFSAAPCAFPSPAKPDPDTQVFKLFHYRCADRGLSVLADDVGGLFDASPDGKRILFEKLTPPEPSATGATTAPAASQAAAPPAVMADDLCVMNANGSDPHVLRSLNQYLGKPQPPLWPAWRGNDQITFIAAAQDAQSVKVDGHDRKVVDVIQYRLTEKGSLEALQSLSGDWKPEIKPYFHVDDAK